MTFAIVPLLPLLDLKASDCPGGTVDVTRVFSDVQGLCRTGSTSTRMHYVFLLLRATSAQDHKGVWFKKTAK